MITISLIYQDILKTYVLRRFKRRCISIAELVTLSCCQVGDDTTQSLWCLGFLSLTYSGLLSRKKECQIPFIDVQRPLGYWFSLFTSLSFWILFFLFFLQFRKYVYNINASSDNWLTDIWYGIFDLSHANNTIFLIAHHSRPNMR